MSQPFTKNRIDRNYEQYSKRFKIALASCGDIPALIAKTEELLLAEQPSAGEYGGKTIQHILDVRMPTPEKYLAGGQGAADNFASTISNIPTWDANILADNRQGRPPYDVSYATQQTLYALANEFHDRSAALLRGNWRETLAHDLATAKLATVSIT